MKRTPHSPSPRHDGATDHDGATRHNGSSRRGLSTPRGRRGLFTAVAVTAAVVGFALPASAAPTPVADLRADGARTGRIDMAGADSAAAGTALFLPNIDDDAVACRAPAKKIAADAVDREAANDTAFYAKKAELEKEPDQEKANQEYQELRRSHQKDQNEADRDMAACNDAADTVVNGAQDAADLARIRTVPFKAAPAGATGRVTVSEQAAPHVHLFVKRPGSSAPQGWELVTGKTVLTADELRHGVELGIEGRDVVRDWAVWDGRADVTLTVTADGAGASDTVPLREAPVLTQLNTQKLDQVLTAVPDKSDTVGSAWRDGVRAAAEDGGAEDGMRTLDTGGDEWAQDIFEPAYTSIPGAGGKPQGMHVLIGSVNDNRRVASRVAFTELAGHDVAAVHIEHVPTEDENSSYDSMGNLETIPPTPGHPAGQIVVGGAGYAPGRTGPASEVLTLLRSQGMQDPLSLDTSWLSVGHIDEFVQFVPAPGSRLGWRAVVADPTAGMRLLKDVRKAGHGDEIMHGGLPKLDWPYDTYLDQRTTNEFLADEQFVDTNRIAAEKIAANVAVLKQKAGLTDADIVRIPSLFTARGMDYHLLQSEIDSMEPGEEKDDAVAKLGAMREGVAEIPGPVNGLVLNGGRYVSPKPYGPVVDGKDVFAEAISAAFEKTGYQVTYLDDLTSPHVSEGEIHCATNTLRDVLGADQRWWAPNHG
ncbi:protein-arginine deiminase family protein [Streptomyces sp. TS71-3]|uniref:protein-arginine deiminase family protein n=1 Tax=Streptomyces sp. TS71-3 TaxID=2733862 RepID=UPI001B1A0F03|nr:protein-arginine deiminase family protein [Streptomyces sp. TS71-3]GHJ39757.1 hypothetical protein Sm713_53660 [Streptomyces sp. TS71-3]